MPTINLLTPDISELIAAGEVIERPSSVIKELVENSIDAGASHITVEIQNGGTTYMRVTDDGCGIAPDQVATAFLRHATSKISCKDDLDRILTLGFRGEALASVSAVAKVEVLTKQKCDEYGTNYVIEGSVEKKNESTGCPDGTTIIIRDIFYNVPVRRKFMKKDSAEANAIVSIMQKIVLSHPEISFKLIKDNKAAFISAGDGELYSAIYGVYGRDFAHDLIPVDHSENGITVKGYVMKPLYSKSNRSFQNFFINGRYVRSVTCFAALEEAYKNLIMTGKYPACVLMLEIPPVTVDVNVHPAKAEVRFSDEKLVFNGVYFAVKNALMASGLIYEFELKEETRGESFYKRKPFEPEEFTQPRLGEDVKEDKPAAHSEKKAEEAVEAEEKKLEKSAYERLVTPVSGSRYAAPGSDEVLLASPKTEYGGSVRAVPRPVQTEKKAESVVSERKPEKDSIEGFSYINKSSFEKNEKAETKPEKSQAEEIKVIGELFKNYILAQWGENMVIIDKHAAHERVIFEKLRKKCGSGDSQLLLREMKMLLSEKECTALEENSETLDGMGFKLDLSEAPFVKINAIPIILQNLNMDEVIPEIAENLCLNKVSPQTHQLDDMLHDLACKAAIKANDLTSVMELQALAEEVIGDENVRHCPHGRPVMFTLSKRDIEKQFKRIV